MRNDDYEGIIAITSMRGMIQLVLDRPTVPLHDRCINHGCLNVCIPQTTDSIFLT